MFPVYVLQRVLIWFGLFLGHLENIIFFLRRDGAMTALLSGVVLVLVLCHTPKTIVNTYESYQVDNHWNTGGLSP